MLIDTKLAPLRKGLLEFVVLRIVGGDQVYVPDILKRLSGTEFATQEGTLYPLLSKLRREQLVDYEWRESELGPPRKYYRLTESGLQQLAQLDDYWQRINHTGPFNPEAPTHETHFDHGVPQPQHGSDGRSQLRTTRELSRRGVAHACYESGST